MAATARTPGRGEWDLPREEAIPRLLEEQGGRLYGLGLRLCRDGHRAEDLVQETFLQAWRHWDRFEGRSSPATWLWSIAARVCLRFRRRRAGEPAAVASLEALLPFGETGMPAATGEAAGPEAAELRERVEEAIAALPLAFRLPLVLRDVIGLPGAEVAAVLGIREATVKTRVHRARLLLRKAVLGALPSRPAVPPSYPVRVCLDLLRAKQEAMDRGVAFPVGNEVVCERCRSVFATLDLAADACRALGRGEMPEALRDMILAETAGAPPTARPPSR